MAESTTAESTTDALPKQYSPEAVEARWYPRWEAAGHFAPQQGGDDAYTIVIPPPNITGSLHMGHALNLTLQDVLIRWRRMCGDEALWLPGCDHAGIATQNVVERQLAEAGESRADIGREAFVERVWSWREESGGTIMHQLRRLGASCDWSRERFTMDEGLSRAVREVFVTLYEDNLIYRGDYIVNWCPRCTSALSDLEVEHEDADGALYHLKYRVDGSDEVLTIATTRPETLLGDTAVAVHPDDDRYRHLVGESVLLPLLDRPIPVVADPYVDREFGTGALKVTPGHDTNDFELGRRHDLPTIQVMDIHGAMNEAAGPYAGLTREDCRTRIVADLEAAGLLVDRAPHRHAVGQCYRCRTVVEPMVSTQWFVRAEPLAKPAIAAVREGKVRLFPESWNNTYFEWMENIRDWCISRQIWWGHQIPAWYCPCGFITVAREDPTACADCGGTTLTRETDVLDTWFSSALWPFSTLGWPDKTPDLARHYPTNTLVTGFDILFFWVARMLMMGLKFMGEVPFRDVYVHALVRDADGNKMSKSRGNVVDPLTIIDAYGTDAFRFTLASMASPGRDIRLAEDRIVGYRNFANKLWNAARFIQMNLPDGAPAGWDDLAHTVAKGGVAERWIVSRLAETATDVNRQLTAFRFDEATRSLYGFIWGDFCDWYLELAKPALNSGGPEADVTRAVLAGVFDHILRLLHPFMPFITEELRARLLTDNGTIMMDAYPTGQNLPGSPDAVAAVADLQAVVTAVRNIRGTMNLSPAIQLDVVVRTDDAEGAARLDGVRGLVQRVARVNQMTVAAGAERPPAAATGVFSSGEVYVPLAGVIDVAAETARLTGQLDKVIREMAQVAQKLDNAKFVSRAPEAVVAKERERQQELAVRETRLRESLACVADIGDAGS